MPKEGHVRKESKDLVSKPGLVSRPGLLCLKRVMAAQVYTVTVLGFLCKQIIYCSVVNNRPLLIIIPGDNQCIKNGFFWQTESLNIILDDSL